MTIKAHQFEHIVDKFQMASRNAGDRLVWFEYEGKIITRSRRSYRSGDLPFQKSMPKQLGLTPNEHLFQNLLPVSAEAFGVEAELG